MGGEDFCEYSLPDHSIPALHVQRRRRRSGESRREQEDRAPPLPSLHSSKFAPVPEPTIRTGVIGMTSAVLELMKK